MSTHLQKKPRSMLKYAKCPSCGSKDADLHLQIDIRTRDTGWFRCFSCGYETNDSTAVKRILNEAVTKWKEA